MVAPRLFDNAVSPGLDWLGAVPTDWEARKLRHVLRAVTERGRPDLPLLSVVRDRGVILRDLENRNENRNFVPDDLTNYKVVRAGQFVMNKMKAWQGSYGIARFDGLVSPAYFVFNLAGVRGDFFHAAIRSRAYVSFFAGASDGVRIGQWDLSQERMKEIPFFVPPPEEQAAIVRYLDHVDGRIGRYIRAKQRLIALLEEQKQAIIHRAVTRGLDAGVRLKPSGVEWLGDIPEHWEVRPLKSLAAVKSGITLGKQYGNQMLVEVPYLRVANVQSGRLDLSSVKTIQIPEEDASRSLLEEGDVLMTEGGDADKLGRGTIWTGEIAPCVHQNHVFAVRVAEHRLRNAYLEVLLGSPYARAYFIRTSKQTTNLASTNRTTIGSFPVPVPPRIEQGRVLESIALETVPFTVAVADATREISLLREYRTRLISDVVTGKLDVREAAVGLPEVDPAELAGILEVEGEEAIEEELEPELEEIAT